MITEVILQHGWGFDANAWSQWVELLQRRQAKVLVAERGYFGAPKNEPSFSKDADQRVVIAHSLGLHLLDDSVLQSADIVVSLSSFVQFHGTDEVSVRRSRRVIKAMIEKLENAPYMVLKDFLSNCYYPECQAMPLICPQSQADLQLLKADLELLDRSQLKTSLLADKEVLIVHGAKDKIVPVEAAETLRAAVPGSRLCILSEGGHAVAFTQPERCLNVLALPGLSPACCASTTFARQT